MRHIGIEKVMIKHIFIQMSLIKKKLIKVLIYYLMHRAQLIITTVYYRMKTYIQGKLLHVQIAL